MTDEQLHLLINGCKDQQRSSQKKLYEAFYGFAMNICLRYAANKSEASDIVNEGFFKLFVHINKYDSSRSFKPWLSAIMHHASIDYYRANIKNTLMSDLETIPEIESSSTIESKLAYDDLLIMVQQLSPAYRAVFNLFAIDGYSHEEIGEMLHISAGTSKSNLFKARMKLQQLIHNAEGLKNSFGVNGSEKKVTINVNQSRE